MQLSEAYESAPADSGSLARLVRQTYENLSVDNLEPLRTIYAEDVCFEDPIHGIQGLDALVAYFQSLFENVERCHFKFHRSVISSDGMFFSWTMMIEHRSLKPGKIIRVEGASYLKYRDGKVYYHRDYFDLGAMVYENVPLLGGVIRTIRNRLSR